MVKRRVRPKVARSVRPAGLLARSRRAPHRLRKPSKRLRARPLSPLPPWQRRPWLSRGRRCETDKPEAAALPTFTRTRQEKVWARLVARRFKLHTTSGGSSDTELNEFAVKPTNWSSGPGAQMITTPVANCAIASRNSRSVKAGARPAGSRGVEEGINALPWTKARW